jgi:hypothetical protein
MHSWWIVEIHLRACMNRESPRCKLKSKTPWLWPVYHRKKNIKLHSFRFSSPRTSIRSWMIWEIENYRRTHEKHVIRISHSNAIVECMHGDLSTIFMCYIFVFLIQLILYRSWLPPVDNDETILLSREFRQKLLMEEEKSIRKICIKWH